MTPSKIFLYFCLSFIGGIFISSFLPISQPILLAVLILAILLISVFWQYKNLMVIGFCLLFLVAGIWRYQSIELGITNNELRKYNDSEEKITLVGIVSVEPDVREKTQKLTIEVKTILPENNFVTTSLPFSEGTLAESSAIEGKILVNLNRYPEYKYGDKLKISGKLESPAEEIDSFNYKNYLKKDGIYSIMNWPKIELLERENPIQILSWSYAKILKFKNRLREIIYQNLSPPQSSILAAIILGDKRKLEGCSQKEIKEAEKKGKICLKFKEKLNIAGVRHIIAISGLHVAILSSILMTILTGIGFWRQQAFWLSIIFITLFIVMTGLQPSAIRAGIMGGFFLLGQYLGRMSVSSRSIVFAGAIMLAKNPLLLKLDVGFQLSFLAMIGIIYLMPIFQDWFRKIPNSFQFRNILAMTLSAQIFTLPILIYNFGYISFVAPLTNILIVPFLYWLMLFGFIFAFSGLVWQPLGWILSLPLWFLLAYITKIIDIFTKIPLAYKTLEISWPWLIFSYFLLGIITWHLQEKQKLKFLEY